MTVTTEFAGMPFPRYPISNITPFTYRDGLTFLEMIEAFRTYINDIIVTGINDNMLIMLQNYEAALAEIIAQGNENIVAVTELFDDFTADITNQQNVYEAHIQGIVNTINNKSGMVDVQHVNLSANATITFDPTWPNNLPLIYAIHQNAVGGWTATFPAGVSGDIVINPLPDSTTYLTLIPNGDGTWRVDMEKVDGFINVRDYGARGDGVTDDTAVITAALTAATLTRRTVLIPPARYVVAGLVVPAGSTIQATGAVFVKKGNTQTYALTLSDDCAADSLSVELAGGEFADAGIQVSGSRVKIGAVRVTTLTPDQVGANALLIGNPVGATISDVVVSNVSLIGFRSPMRVTRGVRIAIRNVNIQNFLTGVYFIDVIDSTFSHFTLAGTSPTSTGGAGNNGLLVEAATDYAVSGLVFEDWIIDGASEHAYRIGGFMSVRDVVFRNCLARKPGNAAGNIATGGAGFKALGLSGHHHVGLVYDNCSVVDGNSVAAGINNHAAFNIGHCDDVTILSPSVRAETRPNSARIGILVFSSNDVRVINPYIVKTERQCFWIFKDDVDPVPLPIVGLEIQGGRLQTNATGGAAIHIDCADLVFTNFNFDTTCDGGNTSVRMITPTGLGGYEIMSMKIRYLNAPTATTTPPVMTTNDPVLEYTGPVYGSFGISAAPGSRYVDTTTGEYRLRKAGAWAVL